MWFHYLREPFSFVSFGIRKFCARWYCLLHIWLIFTPELGKVFTTGFSNFLSRGDRRFFFQRSKWCWVLRGICQTAAAGGIARNECIFIKPELKSKHKIYILGGIFNLFSNIDSKLARLILCGKKTRSLSTILFDYRSKSFMIPWSWGGGIMDNFKFHSKFWIGLKFPRPLCVCITVRGSAAHTSCQSAELTNDNFKR